MAIPSPSPLCYQLLRFLSTSQHERIHIRRNIQIFISFFQHKTSTVTQTNFSSNKRNHNISLEKKNSQMRGGSFLKLFFFFFKLYAYTKTSYYTKRRRAHRNTSTNGYIYYLNRYLFSFSVSLARF